MPQTEEIDFVWMEESGELETCLELSFDRNEIFKKKIFFVW